MFCCFFSPNIFDLNLLIIARANPLSIINRRKSIVNVKNLAPQKLCGSRAKYLKKIASQGSSKKCT